MQLRLFFQFTEDQYCNLLHICSFRVALVRIRTYVISFIILNSAVLLVVVPTALPALYHIFLIRTLVTMVRRFLTVEKKCWWESRENSGRGVAELDRSLKHSCWNREFKFTHEEENEGLIPFLDTLITRKPDRSVKLLVYRKKTHNDQYLHISSYHLIKHKLSVDRTLLDLCQSLVTEEEDRKKGRKTH